MTEKTQETIIAKFVKSSGVMIFLEGQETGIPCELKILSIIKKGDKVQAGNEYRWLVNIDAKGNRAIVNVGPAGEDEQFKSGKEILQENIDAKKAADHEVAAGGIMALVDILENIDAKKAADHEEKKAKARIVPTKTEAEINMEKEAEQGQQRIKENVEYARALAAEKSGKDAQPKQGGIEKIVAETKQRVAEASQPFPMQPTVIKAEVVKETALACQQTASGVPAKTYTDEDLLLIRNMAARNCSEPEFKLLMYLSKTYGLDPLLKQIWAVKRNDNEPALIFAGRDGFLAVAHRSGHFDGMQSGVNYEIDKDGKKVIESAWCKVWRNDMTHPFETQVPFGEYNTGFRVWKSHPSAMILKVAESVCLRKAFSIDGIYAPEEINTEG